jgi:CBS-domain-containing membrane protein
MEPNSKTGRQTPPRIRERGLSVRQEFVLAVMPTAVVLSLLALVEGFSRQRVIFASLASSAFLIYLDPQHPTNSVRSIVASHLIAALGGAAANWGLGEGYSAAAAAMIATIVAMIAIDVVHPPSVGTALTFAFRPTDVTVLSLFMLCLAVIAILVVLQNATLRILKRLGG